MFVLIINYLQFFRRAKLRILCPLVASGWAVFAVKQGTKFGSPFIVVCIVTGF